jgi:hypothetical protein
VNTCAFKRAGFVVSNQQYVMGRIGALTSDSVYNCGAFTNDVWRCLSSLASGPSHCY